MYSKMRDVTLLYEIRIKIAATKQGLHFVTEYANILKSFWLEMDHYQSIQMKCNEDIAMLQRFVERERIFLFSCWS